MQCYFPFFEGSHVQVSKIRQDVRLSGYWLRSCLKNTSSNRMWKPVYMRFIMKKFCRDFRNSKKVSFLISVMRFHLRWFCFLWMPKYWNKNSLISKFRSKNRSASDAEPILRNPSYRKEFLRFLKFRSKKKWFPQYRNTHW